MYCEFLITSEMLLKVYITQLCLQEAGLYLVDSGDLGGEAARGQSGLKLRTKVRNNNMFPMLRLSGKVFMRSWSTNITWLNSSFNYMYFSRHLIGWPAMIRYPPFTIIGSSAFWAPQAFLINVCNYNARMGINHIYVVNLFVLWFFSGVGVCFFFCWVFSLFSFSPWRSSCSISSHDNKADIQLKPTQPFVCELFLWQQEKNAVFTFRVFVSLFLSAMKNFWCL